MKLLHLIVLAFSVMLLSCGDDEESLSIINLDGDNANAPLLEVGLNEASVQFSASVLSDFVDREIKSVRFYLYDVPDQTSVFIYDGNGTQPGGVIYSADFSSSASANGWNIHVLPTPIPIDGSELWVSVKMDDTESIQAIGCDAGPAVSGGDWLFEGSTGSWTPLEILLLQRVSTGISELIS